MALEKRTRVDHIEVHDSGIVQVRTLIEILENGVVLSTSHHRSTIAPGEDCSAYPGRVQAVCAAVHTNELIKTFNAAKAAKGN